LSLFKNWPSDHETAITNERIVQKTGVVFSRTAEMLLSRVEQINVAQTPSRVSRTATSGRCTVHGAGGSVTKFVWVDRPLRGASS
jgi:hypothetical protein